MSILLTVNGSRDPRAGYIAWTPVPLTITNNSNISGPVKLWSESDPGSITKLWFMEDLGDSPVEEIEVVVGTQKTIYVAGMFQPGQLHFGASKEGKDVTVFATFANNKSSPSELKLMVRVRRNANELSEKARNDFLKALAKLNGIRVDGDSTPGPGRGIYVTDFVEMHTAGADATEHGDSHFLPWHRLYLLDLERLLQEENPAVTLPYWRFDEPAPNVFNALFMGATQQIPRDTQVPGGELDPGGGTTPLVDFALNNPLSQWRIRNRQGIPRTARFDTLREPANGLIFVNRGQPVDFQLLNQNQTLSLADGSTGAPDVLGEQRRFGFSRMEGSPHGAAHMSFNGYLNDVPVAPQDPLFFLLHCNVDRLWALWQTAFHRDAPGSTETYPYQRDVSSPDPWKFVGAEQWPWSSGVSQPGQLLPPGTRENNFTNSPSSITSFGNVPKLMHALDPFANRDIKNYLGFAYDDVPFRHSP